MLVGTRLEAGGGGLSLDQESDRIRMDRIDAVSHEASLQPERGRDLVEAVLSRRKGCLTARMAEETDRWMPGRDVRGGSA